MPVKNGESDAEGDVSGAETERSNSSQAHDTSDEEEEEEEEANECDSDDSSEMDASEIERRRAEYLEDLASLERQFGQLREQYYYERISLIDRQLSEVRAGRSEEFLQPQKELDKVYRTRIEVADVLRKFRLQNIEHKYLSEEQAAAQHFESEKQMTMDYLREDLLERIRRLEEDRHNVEISWDNWGNDKRQSKVRGPGRKKAVTVTGPYVVYMLREEDIMEDWTIIRKALKRSSTTAATGGSGGSTTVATTAAGVPSSGGGGGGSGSGGLLSVQLAATAMVGGG